MQSISKITEQSISRTQKPEIPENLNQPGRLLYEANNSPDLVLDELEAAIIQTGLRMGLRTDKERELAKDYLAYVKTTFKTAFLTDLIRSVELASIGEIEKQNQLNVLSVLNLCQWFKIYWTDHRHKYLQKPETKQLPEMSIETKKAEVRKSLETWLNQSQGERILMSAWFYQKFWEWGILSHHILPPETRIAAYNERLNRYALSLPLSIISDPIKRKSAKQMIETCTDEKGKFTPPTKYEEFAKNDLHLLVMEECRNEVLNHFIEKRGVESILRQFDQFHS